MKLSARQIDFNLRAMNPLLQGRSIFTTTDTATNTTTNTSTYTSIRRRAGQWAVLLSTVLLGACFQNDQTEIKQWMQAQKAKTPATIPPVAVPVNFVSAPYTQFGATDPFDDQKLKNVLAKLRGSTANNTPVSTVQPDLSRKREPLESYSLDNVKMTGYILKQGKPSALVSTPNGLFTVVVGNYLGQDFGKIVALNEQELTLKELVQDGSGVWSDRTTKVSLQVAQKEGKK